MGLIRHYQRLNSSCYTLLFLVLFLVSPLASSKEMTETSIANEIIKLVQEGSNKEAFELALQFAPEYEGLVKFDYAFGLACQKVGEHHEAIFAFERVLRLFPKQLTTRYALAISYFSVGNIIAAENEFKLLQSFDTNKKFIFLSSYLQNIKQKKSIPAGAWNHMAQLGFGLDSNANSGTNEEIIGSFVIDESSQGMNDEYASAQWQSSFIKPISKVSRWYAFGRVKQHTFLRNADMSRMFVDVMAGYKHQINSIDYHMSVYTKPMWLDGTKYIDYTGVMADASHSFSKSTAIGASVNLSLLRFENSLLDKNQQAFSFWHKKKLSQIVLKFTLTLGNEASVEPDEIDLGRNFLGLSYQVSANITPTSRLGAKWDYISSTYSGVYSGEERNDDLIKLTLDYHKMFTPNWSWLLKITLMNNDSSNDPLHAVYSFNRAILWNTAQYKF